MLGNRSPDTDSVFIADCFPIALRFPEVSQGHESGQINSKLLKQALNLWKPGSRTALYAVGQYCVAMPTTRGNGNSTEFDGLSEGDVFLKVSGKGSATSAAFYVINADGRSSAHPDLTLPFDSLVATNEPPPAQEPTREPANTPAQPVASRRRSDSNERVSAGTGWQRMWPAWIIAGLVVTIGGLLVQQLRTTKLLKHQRQTTELRLEPVRTGSQWELRWDKNAPAVRAANRAQLTVSDGSRFTKLDLDSSEIQHGYVLYTPESSDVTFRLDMYDRGGRALTESVRALANVSGDQTVVENRSVQSSSRVVGQDSSAQTRSAGTRTTPDLLPSVPSVSRTRPEARSSSPVAAQRTHLPDRVPPLERVHPTTGSSFDGTTAPSAALVRGSEKRRPERESGNDGAPNLQRTAAAVLPHLPAPVPPRTWSAGLATPQIPAYVPPQPLLKPAPVFRKVGALSYSATDVDIVVHVDQDGHVSNARLASESGFISTPLASAALEAARHWTFEAARSHGNRVESDYKIVFRFVPPSQ